MEGLLRSDTNRYVKALDVFADRIGTQIVD